MRLSAFIKVDIFNFNFSNIIIFEIKKMRRLRCPW